jgi:hypothetical protein
MLHRRKKEISKGGRMKTFNWLLLGLLFLFGCGTNSTAPTPKATIQGKVFFANLNDSLIQPIIGASVFTNPPTSTVKTDSQACYAIDVPPGCYTMRAFLKKDTGTTVDTSIASGTVLAISGRVDTVNLFFVVMIRMVTCKQLHSEISDAVGCAPVIDSITNTPQSDTTH